MNSLSEFVQDVFDKCSKCTHSQGMIDCLPKLILRLIFDVPAGRHALIGLRLVEEMYMYFVILFTPQLDELLQTALP